MGRLTELIPAQFSVMNSGRKNVIRRISPRMAYIATWRHVGFYGPPSPQKMKYRAFIFIVSIPYVDRYTASLEDKWGGGALPIGSAPPFLFSAQGLGAN